MPINLDHTTDTFSTDIGPLTFGIDSAVRVPVGPQSSRPSGLAGHLRFDTDTGNFEGYDGTQWGPLSDSIDSTSDVPEGINKYFTDERVDDRVDNLLVAGTNITITYDDTVGTLTIDAASVDLSGNDLTDIGDVSVAGVVDAGMLIYDAGTSTWRTFAISGDVTISDTGVATVADDSHTHDDRYYTETELDAGQLDNRYYTETEADANFVDVTGDTMTGTLTIDDGASLVIKSPDSSKTLTAQVFDSAGAYIQTSSTDNLNFTTPVTVARTPGSNNAYFMASSTGATWLYHNGNEKFKTASTGVEITGNVVVDGTVDGRDVATDGTKLDGIESLADVTDTANVTAAGALMDSEVTNLAQVKAFDSSDYATAAQGTLADNALPITGGTLTGDLKINKDNAAIYLNDTGGTPSQQGLRIRAEAIDGSLPAGETVGVVFESDPANSTVYDPAVITTGEFYAQSDQRVFHDSYHPNADKLTAARTITLGGDVSGSASFDGSADITITAVVADDSHTHSFDNLTSKETGTGNYSTSGTLVSGRGSGGVALTSNDSQGNANVTFNHASAIPEQNGQSGRITVDTDSITDEGEMTFEVSSSAVTSGVSVNLPTAMVVAHDYVQIPDKIRHANDTDTYIQFHEANQWRVVTGGAERLEVNNNSVIAAGSIFKNTSTPVPGITVADSPPGSPDDGDLWYDTDGGSLYVYYTDSTPDSYWVEAGGSTGAGSSGSNGTSPFVDTGTYVYYGGPRNVGIGTATPSEALEVTGNIQATEDVIAYSDQRLKEDIKPINSALGLVAEMRGVRYTKKSTGNASVGVIAQEMQKVLPEVVHTNEETGMLSVAYGNVVGVLVEAIKEQKREVDLLNTQVQEIIDKVNKLNGN